MFQPTQFEVEYNKEIIKQLCMALYPADKIPLSFHRVLKKSLQYESNTMQNIPWNHYKVLLFADQSKAISLYHIGNAINIIETKTPDQLQCDFVEYCIIKDDIAKMAQLWEKLTDPIKNRTEGIVKTRLSLQNKNQIAKA